MSDVDQKSEKSEQDLLAESTERCKDLLLYGTSETREALILYIAETQQFPQNSDDVVLYGMKHGLKNVSFVQSEQLLETMIAVGLVYCNENGIDLNTVKLEFPKLSETDTRAAFGSYVSFIQSHSVIPKKLSSFYDEYTAKSLCDAHLAGVQKFVKEQEINLVEPIAVGAVGAVETSEEKSEISAVSTDQSVNQIIEYILNKAIPTLNEIIPTLMKKFELDPYEDVWDKGDKIGVKNFKMFYKLSLKKLSGLSQLKVQKFGGVNVSSSPDGILKGEVKIYISAAQDIILKAKGKVGIQHITTQKMKGKLKCKGVSAVATASIKATVSLTSPYVKIEPPTLSHLKMQVKKVKPDLHGNGILLPIAEFLEVLAKTLLPFIQDEIINALNKPVQNVLNDALKSVFPSK